MKDGWILVVELPVIADTLKEALERAEVASNVVIGVRPASIDYNGEEILGWTERVDKNFDLC